MTALASVLSTTTIATRPVDWPIVRAALPAALKRPAPSTGPHSLPARQREAHAENGHEHWNGGDRESIREPDRNERPERRHREDALQPEADGVANGGARRPAEAARVQVIRGTRGAPPAGIETRHTPQAVTRIPEAGLEDSRSPLAADKSAAIAP